jgi:hypothetical protein
MLTQYTTHQPSEIAAVAGIPITIARSIISIPAQILQLRVNYDTQATALVNANTALLQAQLSQPVAIVNAKTALQNAQNALMAAELAEQTTSLNGRAAIASARAALLEAMAALEKAPPPPRPTSGGQ